MYISGVPVAVTDTHVAGAAGSERDPSPLQSDAPTVRFGGQEYGVV